MGLQTVIYLLLRMLFHLSVIFKCKYHTLQIILQNYNFIGRKIIVYNVNSHFHINYMK